MNRKIGINWGAYGKLPIDEQIGYMKKYGFEAAFISGGRSHADEVIPKLAEAGISCHSIHAPFDKINSVWFEGEEGDGMMDRIIDSLYACADHGVPVLVVHLSSGKNAPVISDAGVARFRRLMAVAKEKGVKIAYENQRKLANIALMFEIFEDEACFCWDVGHEECFAYGRRFMPLFGDKLVALHVNDNLCEDNGDIHIIPYDGKVDFDRVAKSIADVGYEGPVMLEVIRHIKPDFYGDISADEYYARAAAAAKRLAAKIDEYSK